MQSSDFLGRAMPVTYALQLLARAACVYFEGEVALLRSKRSAGRKSDIMDADAEKRVREEATATTAATAASAADSASFTAAVSTASSAPAGDSMNVMMAPVPMQIVMPPKIILFVYWFPNTVSRDGDDTPVFDIVKKEFARFAVFLEERSLAGKNKIEFVEFASDADTAVATSGLHNHIIGTPPAPMNLTDITHSPRAWVHSHRCVHPKTSSRMTFTRCRSDTQSNR